MWSIRPLISFRCAQLAWFGWSHSHFWRLLWSVALKSDIGLLQNFWRSQQMQLAKGGSKRVDCSSYWSPFPCNFADIHRSDPEHLCALLRCTCNSFPYWVFLNFWRSWHTVLKNFAVCVCWRPVTSWVTGNPFRTRLEPWLRVSVIKVYLNKT